MKHLFAILFSLFAVLFLQKNRSVVNQPEDKNWLVKDSTQVKPALPQQQQSIKTGSKKKSGYFKYPADIQAGLIGSTEKEPVDNPYDNIFHIQLPEQPQPGDQAVLQYELFGVADHAGISHSINDAQAVGGRFVIRNQQWTLQQESIALSVLHKGDNVIRFTLPEAATHYYRIKNLGITIQKQAAAEPAIILNTKNTSIYNNKAYLSGIVQLPAEEKRLIQLFCNGQPLTLHHNTFEWVAPLTTDSFTAHLKAILPGGNIIEKTVILCDNQTADFEYPSLAAGTTSTTVFQPGKRTSLAMNAYPAAGMDVSGNALCQSTTLSITALRDVDLPALNTDLVNVTLGAKGYRFLPHGTKFLQPARVSIPFDSTLIPEGYTAADIRTFYFNENNREWEAIPLDTIMVRESMVSSTTTHFTDMIDGIIKVPESPQTQGYTPTSIKDIKAANPSLGINMIETPKATNMGSAALGYPFKLPGGRQGMQPSLNLQYSNEGGNGWLGLGWNLTIPSIGIETRWGAPRYDATLETETYSLAGEQLAPLAHRGPLLPRTANKQFHPRVEGSFQKIIRQGNNPNNYWWEVTDKEGTRNFYGGTPATGVINGAVLKDAFGNIGFWALVQTIDLNGNTVNYTYQTVSDVGIAGGSVPGQQLYISRINYTGFGTQPGAYNVEFIRDRQLNEPRRKDIDINGRLGFKMVTTDLLRQVKIQLNNQPVRSYELQYQQGAFYKTLLKSVTELDAAGTVFTAHQFDYYDDVNTAGGYTPLGNTENWSPAFDNIKGDISNPIPGFGNESSALSTAKSKNSSRSLAVTLGFWNGFLDKSITVGGSVSSSSSKTEGLVTMVDINGDGLPDKVFRQNGQLWYRANLGSAVKGFGGQRPLTGTGNFSAGKTKSTSRGLEVNLGIGFWGNNRTSSTTTTTDYFSDFNGDGLIDICTNGQVLFNRIGSNGDPIFLPGSAPTPSPITGGSNVSPQFLAPDTALQRQQEIDFPLQDIIRLWKAPFSGTVFISAPVQLVNTGAGSIKKDGVRVSVQLGGNVLWSTSIASNNFSVQNPTGLNAVPVLKGQNVYFRVQSVYNGEEDLVNWDPKIQYLTPIQPAADASNRSTTFYQASQDFVLHNAQGVKLSKKGIIKIDGVFSKGITSDTVVLSIVKQTGNISTTILQQSFSGAAASQPILLPAQAVDTSDQLRFVLYSDSYIDRSQLQWTPHFEYTAFADGSPVTNSNGTPTIEGWSAPVNNNYNDWLKLTPLLTNIQPNIIAIEPFIKGSLTSSGNVTFTVKRKNQIIGKKKIQVVNGAMTGTARILVTYIPNDTLYCEYHTDDRTLAQAFTHLQYVKIRDCSYIDAFGNLIYAECIDSLNAGLFTQPAEDYLGTLYRGWGHFSFRGIQNNNSPLDETKINTNGLQNYSNDPNLFADSALFNQIIDASQTDFIPLYADILKRQWVGFDSSVFVTGTQMSSARLWEHDVTVDSLMTGGSVTAVNKITTAKTRSTSLGIGAPFGLPFNVSRAVSENNTANDLDMQDLNGDRYPDVLHLNNVQYTLPTGGLQQGVRTHNLGASAYQGKSTSYTLGGSGTLPEAQAKNTPQQGAAAQAQKASSGIGISISGGASLGENKDASITTWLDINGDGLPDKVYANGTVALNLGYSFAPAEFWGVTDIEKNTSDEKGVSASLGFNLGGSLVNGSFQFGASLQRSNGEASTSFTDVNGDGLVDKLLISGNQLTVRLNQGNGFGPAISWNGLSDIRKNSGTGESFNAAFTITIPIPIPFFPLKICINPGFTSGNGVSRENHQVMDIDGDGYPDVLQSANDGNLTARRSLIGRTNMLRSVQRPMGSSFTIDYERVGNTYALPQSKWVLKNVEITDGVPGDGVDTMRQTFSYSNPNYDRHERDFFGFATVTTRQLNTAAANTVYRSTIQQYSNNSYYAKGLLQTEWLQNANGNRYTQTNNTYQLRPVADSVVFPALIKTDKLFYEGAATAGVSTSTQMDYDALGNITKIDDAGDGSQQDLIKAVITYHNNNPLYIKGIPATIDVTTAQGLQRSRATSIDAQGNLVQIRQFLANGNAAVYDMEYDQYGNLAKITRPVNYKGQRFWYAYTYDNTVQTYVTKVTDAFGYSSSSTYDFRFGELLSTLSMNNEPMRYQVDNRGRVTTITGPYEIAAGKPYTIAFDYHPEAVVPYATTRHYDPEHNADINTVTLMDGMGRAIQVKKQVSLFTGKNQPDNLRMVVSGRVYFDAFGRTIENRYPITEAIGASNNSFNLTNGLPLSISTYDVLDRNLTTRLADAATTTNTYTITNNLFSTMVQDPLQNNQQTLTDVRGRTRFTTQFGGPAGPITTRFQYNALSELIRVVDAGNNATTYTYDNLGRKLSVNHPDAGLTEMVYDLAGNMTQKITPQIRKEIPNGGAINYLYDYERISDIDYPRQYQNQVNYKYGAPNTGHRTGRLILQQDASGGQEFYYGKLGEITKTIRTVMVNSVFYTTYVSEQEYDTWNRIKKMTYPDGEVVKYHYNKGGSLASMDGAKTGNTYPYVNQLGYDEYEQRVYLQYGNGTDTKYKYDSLRRRLVSLQAATATNRPFMDNSYSYDAVSNVLGVTNSLTFVPGQLGGRVQHRYYYDNLYRLTNATGTYRATSDTTSYNLSLTYDNLYNITSKQMLRPRFEDTYNNNYTYGGTAPHQPTQVGLENFAYDLNGNLLRYGSRQNFWDEENRLMANITNGILSRYTYDAGGERVIKSSGNMSGNWLNGAPAGLVSHDDNYSVYVSPYVVCRRTGFTKHYYIESQRIATKIGIGRFTNIVFPQPAITAGGIDYLQRQAKLQKQRYDYYASLGISPGPPTDKYYYAHPYVRGIASPVIIDSSSTSIPPGWPGYPGNITPPPAGPPIFVSPIPSNDSVKAGYGFVGTGFFYEQQQYFYHPDHLGSTSYISNVLGQICQHQEYSGFGETFVDEHTGSNKMPYLFNAKEKDTETGLYYYGARYYDPRISLWISVDPMAEKYLGVSVYNYCLQNPIRLIDEKGEEPEDTKGLVVSTILNLTPGVGTAKGIAEAISGEDAVTGEKLAWWERGLGILPVVGGIAKGLKSGVAVGKGLKTLDAVENIIESGAKGAGKADDVIDGTKTGGRLGSAATRNQINDIATDLESRGYTITGGGGRKAEEYLKPLGGGRKGSSYPDITATHPNRPTLRINTVDVLKDGVTPTSRELNNAARIRTQIGQGEHLLLIPKNKR